MSVLLTLPSMSADVSSSAVVALSNFWNCLSLRLRYVSRNLKAITVAQQAEDQRLDFHVQAADALSSLRLVCKIWSF